MFRTLSVALAEGMPDGMHQIVLAVIDEEYTDHKDATTTILDGATFYPDEDNYYMVGDAEPYSSFRLEQEFGDCLVIDVVSLDELKAIL